MNRVNIIGVSWVLSYGALVLVFGGLIAWAGGTPEMIVMISIIIFPFVAQLPGLLLLKIRRNIAQ